jgi:HEAT repeat protein
MAMIDRLLLDVQIPTGDDATLRLRDHGVARLLELGAEAEARVIALLTRGEAINPPALYELLSRIGGERGARYLRDLLRTGTEGVTDTAAVALARSRAPGASDLLMDCLANERESVVVSALMALRVTGLRVPCAVVVPLLRHPVARVRFHAAHLANAAGFLDQSAVGGLLETERDPEVRGVLENIRQHQEPCR